MEQQLEMDGMPAPIEIPQEPFFVNAEIVHTDSIVTDLVELIRKFPKEYASVYMLNYQEWERPAQFLWECIEDFVNAPKIDARYFDDLGGDMDVDIRWTSEMYEQLCRVCPEARINGD